MKLESKTESKTESKSHGKQDTYETSDIAVAAFLRALGYDLSDVDRANEKRIVFKFKDDGKISIRVSGYWNYKEGVCPLTYHQKLRELKMVVFCGKE